MDEEVRRRLQASIHELESLIAQNQHANDHKSKWILTLIREALHSDRALLAAMEREYEKLDN